MRVYVPATLTTVRGLLATGALGGPVEAYAVTPALREWYVDDDAEALEYAALTEAARASLRRLAADPAAPRRRVVLAADVSDRDVRQRAERGHGAVDVTADVPLAAVAAGHVDEPEAVPVVARAADLVAAADAGDEDAEFAVGDAEDLELLWYATQELADLVN
ncbi:MAG TPA: hypothetical protein VMI11_13120 [Actinomycetes bacterium]|nr:hypothetical protein [Actinomycetes bacterium]